MRRVVRWLAFWTAVVLFFLATSPMQTAGMLMLVGLGQMLRE